MNSYVSEVLSEVKNRYYWEKEFLQSVTELFESISTVIDAEPKYRKQKLLERLVEPERIIMFKVPWHDDRGEIHVNRGYRVEFNSALGPYKGGLRFHASVTLGTLKCLAFEQIFKNALTGLPMGGGKGGSDFHLRGRSDMEAMRFCQSFMTELYRHIGAHTDVPAGDIGVGSREVGYLFGQYKRLKNTFEGVLTGKGVNWGGSLVRPEATGYGLVYFAEEMLKTIGHSLEGKIIAVSGFGNVAWGAVKKATQLGAKVVTLSGPDGFVYDPDGIKGEKIDYMLEMRASGHDLCKDYADKFNVQFFAGKKPWGVKCDIALPCATQNEIDENDVKELIKNGVLAICEGSNMSSTLEAVKLIQENKILYSPGKASNAGGVACSGLEMAQNSSFSTWSAEEVDNKLKQIMINIHNICLQTAHKYGHEKDYLFGANVAGFLKVADAMIDQGLV